MSVPAADARAAILARVRGALGPAPEVPDVPRAYAGAGAREPAGAAAVVERFAERVADYQATVHRVGEADLPALLDELAAGGRVRSTLDVGPGTGATSDDGVAALDALDVVVTGCATAIADTGTIVLDGGARSGPRALTLIPDHHVCVVRHDQVVAAVPDAVARFRAAVDAGRPITLVSGPSATSDIELERVEGVHGPRRLDVVLVG